MEGNVAIPVLGLIRAELGELIVPSLFRDGFHAAGCECVGDAGEGWVVAGDGEGGIVGLGEVGLEFGEDGFEGDAAGGWGWGRRSGDGGGGLIGAGSGGGDVGVCGWWWWW